MSSSKGIGSSAKEVSDILPPYLLRFVFVRTDFREAIDFDPIGTMVIPDLFDEYDRCWQAYNTGSDENLGRVFEYSQINKIPSPNPKLFLPRFRDIANYIQHPTIDLAKKNEEIKGSSLTSEELQILNDRERYARIWTEKYAPDGYRLHMVERLPDEVSSLKTKQKEYLDAIIYLLDRYTDPEELQLALYDKAKEMGLPSKDAFAAIYTIFLGKRYGPKAAWFLLQYPKEKIVRRLKEAVL
jgi:lysyl-tRNA synthetase class 1